MRHRSPTNSHNGEDRALREEYRAANPHCELWPYLKDHIRVNLNGGVEVPLRAVNRYSMRVEVNHIWSLGQRPDIWPNLISFGWPVHNWFHAHLEWGRVACLYAKWKKGGEDWNSKAMFEVIGKYPLGWLEFARVPGVLEDMRQQILSRAA